MKGQVAIPETAEELEELLNDDGRLGEILAAGQLAEFNRAYMSKSLAAKGGELAAQMREQTQLGLQAFLQEQAANGVRPSAGGQSLAGRDGRRARAISNSALGAAAATRQASKQGLFNGRAMGAGLDDEDYAESIGKFLYTTHKAERDASKRGDVAEVERVQNFKDRVNKAITNAMTERIPSEGGFLLPENLRSEVLMVALEDAIVRPKARIIPMDSLRVPLPLVDDVSHQNSVYGGVVGFWAEEGSTLQASAPSWGRIVLEARKLTAYTAIPNELLQDSITPLDTWFNTFFPKAIAWFEDVAFISGSGAGEPQGILNAPGAVTVQVANANTITWDDIASAYSRMWPASLNNAVWLCSPDVLTQLLNLAVATNVSPPLWLDSYQALGTPGSGTGDGVNYRLMGRPLIVSEKMPACGGGNSTTAGALTFVDLSYYLIGDRQTMQVASSDEYLFGQDMVAYRVIERLDGRFWLNNPITPENGSQNPLSPLVKIDTAHAA